MPNQSQRNQTKSEAKKRSLQDIQAKLIKELAKVDRPASFCAHGECDPVLPGLEVKGVGQIGLPLTNSQARELIDVCQQAPYGKGTKTVVDTSVRKVWELDPKLFQLKNRKWNLFVDSILVDVGRQLGLKAKDLTASLYKLLLYEKGGFFLPHRDGEKLDGMVATLVIALPAEHTGGELVITHKGKQHQIKMQGASTGSQISYASFFADCEHEVKPVKSGHRLCLTYNISLARKTKTAKPITAPDFDENIKAISQQIAELFEAIQATSDSAQEEQLNPEEADASGSHDEELPSMIAITLDHRYTEKGLTLDRLKGVDRSRASAIFDALESTDFDVYLALVTRWLNGAEESGYDDYYDRDRYGRYDDEFDDEDDEDDDDEDEVNRNNNLQDPDEEKPFESRYVMGEIFDSSLSVSHWSDRLGKRVELGEFSLNDNEIVSVQPLEDWEPSREDYEGYTGNAGMTLERWYHRAAVVIWPKSRRFRILCEAGTDSAICGLHLMIQRLEKIDGKNKTQVRKSDVGKSKVSMTKDSKSKQEQPDLLRNDCLNFANSIIDSWDKSYGYSDSLTDKAATPIDRKVFCDALCQLGDVDLVKHYIATAMAIGDAPFDSKMAECCRTFGWEVFSESLHKTFRVATGEVIMNNAKALRVISKLRDKDSSRIKRCQSLGETLLHALKEFDTPAEKHTFWQGQVDRAEFLFLFAEAMLAVDDNHQLSQMIDYAFSQSGKERDASTDDENCDWDELDSEDPGFEETSFFSQEDQGS